MTEWFAPVLLFLGLLASHGLGRHLAHRWHAKWDVHGVKAAHEEAEAARLNAVRAKHEADSASRAWRRMTDELAQVRQALEAVIAERDAYKVIAASHEVKWPKPEEVQWEEVWASRRYQSTFDNNLERLQRDLMELKEQTDNGRITVAVRVYPTGWWENYYNKTYKKVWGLTDSNGRYFHFRATGRPEELGADLLDLLRCMEDSDHLPIFCPKNKKEWRAPEDPVVFLVTASIWPKPQSEKPPVQIVEVLKTETKVIEVERIVEVEKEASPKLDSELLAAVLEVETLGKKAMITRERT